MLCSNMVVSGILGFGVVVAVQRRHVKMYSPRKTWESSQPYEWQASRTGGLKGRKNTDWELHKLVLTFVLGCMYNPTGS